MNGLPTLVQKQPSLWHNPAFVRLWIARIVSGIGTSVTNAAIPLTASLVLDASPAQMAWLVFATQLPDLLFGLLAGVWVDRVRRRRLLVSTDLARALSLATIPVASVLGVLAMPVLWAVTFVSASLTLVFTLASVAILPAVVRQEQLVEANARMHMSDAVLSLLGPGGAGFLVQLVTAPKAIIADVVSYIASAFALGGIGMDETQPEARERGPGPVVHEIREGLHELIRTPLLRALAVSMGIIVVGGAMFQTVNILYLTRTLGLSPFVIGLVAAGTGVGALLGAAIASRVASVLSLGLAIVAPAVLEAGALLATPLASVVPLPVPYLMAVAVCMGVAFSVLSINQISLRQRITPNRLLGRVTAARRFLIFCMGPFGALAGGWLGTSFGYEVTIVAAGCVTLLAAAYMWASPIRSAPVT